MNIESISLAFNDLAQGGSSNKVYHINLVGSGDSWTVEAQWGGRGRTLTSQKKADGVSYEEAREVYDKLARRQLAKGYLIEGTAPEPQVAPSGKPIVMLPPELLEEINNGQGPDRFIADGDYWMQDKSDGHSRGVIKQNGEMVGMNKLGQPVPLPAHLVKELGQLPLERFQLDAELVGMRLICRDILIADEDITLWSYERRFTRLRELIEPLAGYVTVVETWIGEQKAPALVKARADRREGVVFKLRSAPYRAGRNGQHKKYKFIKALSAICGEPHFNGKQSVDLFLLKANSMQVPCERVRCGTVSLIGKPTVKAGDIVEVQYLYAGKSGLMTQARMLHLRDDVTADQCTTAQLIYKREEAE